MIGFSSAIITLVILCLLTFTAAVGVGGWEAIVFPPGSSEPSDSPLPLALAQIVGESHFLYHLLITVGLFGLVASFHGIILAAGRSTFEFGRVGYVSKSLGKVHPKTKTPAKALVVNMLIGILCVRASTRPANRPCDRTGTAADRPKVRPALGRRVARQRPD